MGQLIPPTYSPTASISFHFEGTIAENHQVTARVLGKTLDHLQNAIDRTYLELKYGNVIKYQRLREDEYQEADFIVGTPREGGFILDLLSDCGKSIADRFANVIIQAYDKDLQSALDEKTKITQQADLRRKVYLKTKEAQNYEDFIADNEDIFATNFAERSIAKEVDQVLSLIRTDRYSDSIFEITAYGHDTHPVLKWDKPKAQKFHQVVSERGLGDPVIVPIEIRSLDKGGQNQNPKGKGKNQITQKEFHFTVVNSTTFNKLTPFLSKKKLGTIIYVIACPIYEYNSFDHNSGDMFIIDFLKVAT
jgi:hypothetical protein